MESRDVPVLHLQGNASIYRIIREAHTDTSEFHDIAIAVIARPPDVFTPVDNDYLSLTADRRFSCAEGSV
jgi:hypothetical protein